MDDFGTPVWWLRHIRNPLDVSVLEDGTVAFARGSATPFGTDDTAYEIRRLERDARARAHRPSARAHRPPRAAAACQRQLPDPLLQAARRRRPQRVRRARQRRDRPRRRIQELTPSGRLVWSWNSKDHIPLADTGPWWSVRQRRRRARCRTVAPPTTSCTSTPSSRTADGLAHLLAAHQRVYRIRRIRRRHALWKLGGTATAESLTIGGDSPSPLFSGQHDVAPPERRERDRLRQRHPAAAPAASGLRFSVDATGAGTATRLEVAHRP